MAITLNIVKNSDAYTNMRIYRSLVKETVYAGAPIANVAIAASYVDATTVDGQPYFYGIELYNASDKTQFTPIKAISVADFGPFNAQVQAHIAAFGSPVAHGDVNFGTLFIANLAQFSNMPGAPNTKAKLEELWLAAGNSARTQSSTDAAMIAAMIDGKIVVFPTIPNLWVGNGTAVATHNADFKKVVDYLAANPNQALIDISGYRWKIKTITKELLVKYPEIMRAQFPDLYRRVPRVVDMSVANANYNSIYSEVDANVVRITMSTNPATADIFAVDTTTSNVNRYAFVYFEYVGQTLAP